jgi:nickel-dependent lactate racemase
MPIYRVPYDKGEIEFELPDTFLVEVARARAAHPVPELEHAIRMALEDPIGSPRLRHLVHEGAKILIAVTDITRACPDEKLLPPLLEEIHAGGVPAEDVTILVGVGMHRASTPQERIGMLGPDVVKRYRVIDHDPLDQKNLINMGHTTAGVPVVINKLVAEADVVVSTGLVEPHLYAGYSGGYKTIAVGCAGEKTITYTHGPRMLDHPGTRLGRTEDNPFQQALIEIGKRAGLRFIINVVLDEHKRVLKVCAGEPAAVHKELVIFARDIYEYPVAHSFDVAIAGVGFPKDRNIYQMSRAPSYLMFAVGPVVRKGGLIIVPAPCPEGVGQGAGEQRFMERFSSARDMKELIEKMRLEGYRPGEQRAYVMAKVLSHCEVAVVGAKCPQTVEKLHMKALADMNEAVEYIRERFGKEASVLIVPHSLVTLPILYDWI